MTRAPKKSESLEIRIPFEAKLAFMEACRREERSASEVLRELIDGRLAATPPARRHAGLVRWIAAALAALGLAGAALPSLARPDPRAEFTRYDRNADGVIDRAEFVAVRPTPLLHR